MRHLPAPRHTSSLQADIDIGSVTFITTANINGINSAPVTTTVPIQKPQALSLDHNCKPTTYDQAGRQIIFTYVIKNIGSTILAPAQFTISDSLISTAPFNCGDVNATLAPAATVTCTATYTVSEANVSAASITSIATASGAGSSPSQATNTTINKGAVVQPNAANLVAGSTISHTVIDGDWLWQIARCYGTDPTKVVRGKFPIGKPCSNQTGHDHHCSKYWKQRHHVWHALRGETYGQSRRYMGIHCTALQC